LHSEFGHRVTTVEVGGDNGGCCKLALPQDVDPLDYIISLCGGKAAVDRWFGWRLEGEEDENWHGSDDYRKANKVALEFSNGDAAAAAQLMKWAEAMAAHYVEKHWKEFHAPARMLALKRKLEVEKDF